MTKKPAAKGKGNKARTAARTKASPARKPGRTSPATKAPADPLARLEARNPQWLLFLRQYMVDLNGRAAAERAGYAKSAAKVQACRILGDPLVQEALALLQAARAKRIGMNADRVLAVLEQIALVDVRRFYDPITGTRLPVHQLPDDVVMAVSSIELVETETEKSTTRRSRLRLVDRKGCLELIGRHFGAWRSSDPTPPDGSLPTGAATPPAPGQPVPVQVEGTLVIERRVVHVNRTDE